ncbi:MAG: type IX secretion/gliding motility protein PorT/SprT [Arcticibacter sp.]
MNRVSIKHSAIYWSMMLLLLFCSTTSAWAQRDRVKNLPAYDRQRVHFGFLLGLNTTDFKIKRIPGFNSSDTLFRVESDKQSGFNIGIIANVALNELFSVRFAPDLAFSQRNLYYTFYDANQPVEVLKEIESTFLEFPFDLKLKSKRVNNYRMYVLAGVRYNIDMVSQAKVQNKDKDFVKLKRNDYGYQYGIGIDFYMERFKFGTELKMYHGFRNLLVDDPAIYSSSIDALRSRIFQISFTFE